MIRRLRAWLSSRKNETGNGSPVETTDDEADLIKLISSAQSNLPGRPL